MNEPHRGAAPQPHTGKQPTRREAARRRRRRQQRRACAVLLCVVVLAAAAGLIVVLSRLLGSTPAGAGSTAVSLPQETPAPMQEPEATPEPTAEPEPVTDPNFVCSWDTTGIDGFDYLIAINRAENNVTIFTRDDSGQYTVPYFAMICSTGEATPLGEYRTIENYRWRYLQGDVYGQYATRIVGHILFHSVPYFTQNVDDLEYEEFNKLGTDASLGCIRLQVADAKWIYDNCPIGTPVVLYDDTNCPGPLGKPDFVHTDVENTTLRGWDPTDPDPANPWNSLTDENGQPLPQPTTRIPA